MQDATKTNRNDTVLGFAAQCAESRLMELEAENSRLKQLVTELLIRNQELRGSQAILASAC